MKNERINLTETDFADIKRIAAEYQIEALPFAPTKAGGNYGFQHPSKRAPWVRGCSYSTGTGAGVGFAFTDSSFLVWSRQTLS
jgi:hypothetical protein